MATRSLKLTFTLACVNGHRREVDETEGQRLNGTACDICYKPMFVQRLNVGPANVSPVDARRCPQHSNGDPCCWRQNGWVSSLRQGR
jgi:hypothetical protein